MPMDRMVNFYVSVCLPPSHCIFYFEFQKGCCFVLLFPKLKTDQAIKSPKANLESNDPGLVLLWLQFRVEREDERVRERGCERPRE